MDPSTFKSSQLQYPTRAVSRQSTPSTLPPAYSSLSTNAAIPQPNVILNQAIDDEYDDCIPLSPISLNVSAPLKITGHGNVISIDSAASTAALTASIVAALQQTSMIDEEGRTRPLTLTVTGGVSILGSRNVVGRAPGSTATEAESRGRRHKRRAQSVRRLVMQPCGSH
jgi:hypothetical protein